MRNLRPATFIATSLALASVGWAQEQQWHSSPDTYPFALIEYDGQVLSAFCTKSNMLVMVYDLDPGVLDPALANLSEVDLVLWIDGGRTKHSVTVKPKTNDNGSVSVGFGGAGDWARLAMGADETIHVGLSPNAGANEFFIYNVATFTALGSTAAIRPVIDTCG